MFPTVSFINSRSGAIVVTSDPTNERTDEQTGQPNKMPSPTMSTGKGLTTTIQGGAKVVID